MFILYTCQQNLLANALLLVVVRRARGDPLVVVPLVIRRTVGDPRIVAVGIPIHNILL